jgi:hypothetical protein
MEETQDGFRRAEEGFLENKVEVLQSMILPLPHTSYLSIYYRGTITPQPIPGHQHARWASWALYHGAAHHPSLVYLQSLVQAGC